MVKAPLYCGQIYVTAKKLNKMKKTIGIISTSLFLMIFIFTGCSSSPAEKVENAEQKVTESQDKLNESKEDYTKEMEEYKEKTAEQIAANEKSIQEFNARIANQKSSAKADYQKKIAELDAKNSDLKKKMAEFKAYSKSSWETFKTEFSRDMDELGNALHDFTVKNEK